MTLEQLLHKNADISDLDGVSVPADQIDEVLMVWDADDKDQKDEPADTEVKLDELPEVSVTVSEEDGEPDSVVFEIPLIPGAEDQSEIVEEPATVEVEEEENVEIEQDPYKWTLQTFLPWMKGMINNCPKHSGRDVSGLERAIAFFKYLSAEFPKVLRQDIKGELDVNHVEDVRDQVHNAIERLEERLERIVSSKYKKKKKADEELSLVKEASKAGGFVVSVDLFTSAICRLLINSMVSAGHDIEVSFKKLDKKYKFTPREKLQIIQLLADMGYAMPQLDRGLIDEEFDATSSDNFDLPANYPA